jgi:hypothetical protein
MHAQQSESWEFIFIGLQDADATSPQSGPKDAFSRSSLGFEIKQHQYLQVARQSPGSGPWQLESRDFIDWKETDGVRKLCLVGEREYWKRLRV